MPENFIVDTVKVKYIELTSYKGKILDITNLVTDIDIYENIYVNTITGTIDVLDSNELPQFFPIIGEETLEMELLLPGFDDSQSLTMKKFRVYKLSNREIRSNKLQSYRLWFTSTETITNIEQRICKAWKQKQASTIAKDCFKVLGSDKDIEVENTQGVFNYISTNLNPLQVLNYIASNKSINIDKLSDYAFYESIDLKKGSKFFFKSIGGLMKTKPIADFTYNPVTLKGQRSNIQPFNIENIEFKKGFDVIENKLNGLYNQTIVYYDLLRKRYVVQKNEYEDVFKETSEKKVDGKGNAIVGKKSGTPSEYLKWVWVSEFPQRINSVKDLNNIKNKAIENNRSRGKSQYFTDHTDISETNSNMLDQTLFRRTVLLREYENNKIFLNNISGNYNYNIGKLITFQKPHIVNNYKDINDRYGDDKDLFISGNYIIVKSRHHISRGQGLNWTYKNFLEVTKNTLKTGLDKV
jgi:hypothetical protein